MLTIEQLHEKVLYPIVRVRTQKAGGSGTIIYSKQKPDSADYETYVLTNEHVIDDCIIVKKAWDSVLKKNIEKEFLTPCTVEIFSYVKMSKRDSGQTFGAEIIAYDKEHDLAILKLDSPTPAKHVATIYPKGKEDDIKLFSDIWCCGCSLGHEPLINKGQITSLKETIDNKLYWMSNAHSIFGNSGGAIFLADTGEFIGVPSRITAMQLGFGVDIITWMGFFGPIVRVYEFVEEQELQFLYDEKVTSEECFARRKEKEEQLKKSMKEEKEDE